MIGLAVMGENLALNMEDKGFTVAIYNRTVPGVEEGVVERFINGRGKGKNFIGSTAIQDFVQSIAIPRKIMMMVKAGKPVDELIDQLIPLLDPGDILIDGGNSHFPDTIRRTKYLESKGMLFIGTGVSGGEEGALHGPSIMPGGSPAAWPHVKPILQAIAAKLDDGTPCCDWVGENGAGHFVKMIHNGIEYGLMQAYAEGFDVMRNATSKELPEAQRYDLNLAEIAEVWRRGSVVGSWLLDLTAMALLEQPTLENYSGFVQDSGEGRWTIQAAIEEAVPVDVLAVSLFTRFRSRQENTFAEKILSAMRHKFGGHIERPTGG
jgi:6-phosphogluconate dehydrogenase